MSEPIHLVICIDANTHFQKQCMVMLFSLLTHNQYPIQLHIIHTLDAKETFQIGRDSISHFVNTTNVTLNRYPIDETSLAKLGIKVYNNLPLTTYFRLLTPNLLPETITKCLYLDGDMIIRDDIGALYNTDISAHRVAWVATNVLTSHMQNIQVNQYINAGVLLINISARRNNNVSSTIINFCATYPNGLQGTQPIMGDQCGINYVCREHILTLAPQYNTTPVWFHLYDFDSSSLGYEQTLITQAVTNPVILHFAGTKKPADWISFHPFSLEYYNYMFRSGLVEVWDFFKYVVHFFSYPLNYARPILPLLKTVKHSLIDKK